MMKILDDYLKAKQEIHEYFGYKEDWVVIPIEDRREYFWTLMGESDESADSVRFASDAKELEDEDNGNYYEDEIYTQRFLDLYIYRKDDYTMICVDTNTDGNKFLAIYDNKKEVKEQ